VSRYLIETLEVRLLPAWAPYAQLVHQDLAASDFPTLNGKGVTVAMIDTGIDYNLPALGGGFGPGHKVIAGYDFVDNTSDPLDVDGHGTDTAFTVAGNPITVNGITYQGVAPDANLIALKAGTESGGFTDANIDAALQWVIANYKKYNISIVNMSIGAGSYTSAYAQSPESADLATLKKDGIFLVAASGNSNESTFSPITQDGVAFPAADPNVFAVGAVDSTDTIASWAQRGTELDFLAPGVSIVMPDITSTTGGPNGSTVTEDGTSFASPYTAGAAALIKQEDPAAQPGDIGAILMSSGTEVRDGTTNSDSTTGLLFSSLNVDAALKLVASREGKTSTLSLGSTFSTALDSNGVLYAAYYDAKHHDLLFATRDASGDWSTPQVIDKTGDVGSQLSIAVDSTSHIGIAYYDASTTSLKYAYFSGTGWSTTTVDANKHTGLDPSLSFSIYGNAYIGYQRKTGSYLRLASLDRDSNTWSITTVDGGSYGSGNGAAVGSDLSLSVNEATVSGGFFTQYDTTVALAYTDDTNHTLKYARLDVVDPTATWYIAVVDATSAVNGISLNLHNGPQNVGAQAQISYRDTKTGQIKYAYRYTDWFTSVVTNDKTTGNTQITFDSNDFPIITYYNATKGATYSSTLASNGTTWDLARDGLGGSLLDVSQNDRTDDSLLLLLDRAKSAATTDDVV
jgi:subtilisin family serine protease